MHKITSLAALEVLDSRGRPTVQTTVTLASGVSATASVPSGASTGTAEANELRDGEPRYRGLGCRKAVANVNGPLQILLTALPEVNQSILDQSMIAFDGTPNKSRMGANAILSVSIAFARAVALQKKTPLYQHFASIVGGKAKTLPRLTVNLFSGGKHAGGQVEIQDVLLVPVAAKTIDQSLSTVYAVFQAAAELCKRKYNMRALRADEGGLAPPFTSINTMLSDAVEAIAIAGFEPGREVALAVDVASSHFYGDHRYHLGGKSLDARAMIDQVRDWVEHFPIISIEDGLSEDDWTNWPRLRDALHGKAMVLGDDFLCTNPQRIGRAIEEKCADALLLKVNQIGTLTEAAEACRLAKGAGWRVTVSARSGETEDNWLADLATGWSGDQIKIGSITQSERLAKYNRLLAIEAETMLPVAG